MKVTLRKKELTNNRERLYLDIYNPESHSNKRIRESIHLHIFSNPKTAIEKNHNKETMALAENIKAKRQLELQSTSNGFRSKELLKLNFIEYFEKLTNERKSSPGNYGNWDSALKHLKKVFGDFLPFGSVNEDKLEKFKSYLIGELSKNSASSYFAKVKAAVNQAFEDRILEDNPAKRIKAITAQATQRQFLTESELKLLVKTECDTPIMKKAFMFSAFTGLRWSDVVSLKWGSVYGDSEAGYYILYRQKKTKKNENLPLSNNIVELLGERKKDDDKVFAGLVYSAWYNSKLALWVMKAGINKHITFHCARHTYATLLLTNSVDLYTVSKLLGHNDIRTTQIYSRVVDLTKKNAVERLPVINWGGEDEL